MTKQERIDRALNALQRLTGAGNNFVLGAMAAKYPDALMDVIKLLERHARDGEMPRSYWLND